MSKLNSKTINMSLWWWYWFLKSKNLFLFPELPQEVSSAVLIEDPQGGVILVGGKSADGWALNTLYRLQHAGPGKNF